MTEMTETEKEVRDADMMLAFCAYIDSMLDLFEQVEDGLDTGDGAEE